MRRFALAVLALTLLIVVGAPLYYRLTDAERPELPAAGFRVELSDGARLNVLDSGGGATGQSEEHPIVLVHGLPGSAYDWRPLYERLSASAPRVIAYDRKGYGHSDVRGDGEAHSLDANAAELLGLLEALDLHESTVVGWSYGGGVVIRAAEIDPSRIGRVVLLASLGPHPAMTGPGLFERLFFTESTLAWVASVPPISLAATQALSLEAFSEQAMPPWWVPQTQANLAREGSTRAMVREGEEWPGVPLTPESIERPILVIHGTEDRSVPFAVGEDLFESTQPHSEMLRVEGGSHMIPITHAPLLAESILEFSRGPASASMR